MDTGSTISCLWRRKADHARVPVMVPRQSYSDMCHGGSNVAVMQPEHPANEPGRVHGVSDLDQFALPRTTGSNKRRLLAIEEKWRWRRLVQKTN